MCQSVKCQHQSANEKEGINWELVNIYLSNILKTNNLKKNHSFSVRNSWIGISIDEMLYKNVRLHTHCQSSVRSKQGLTFAS